MEICKQIAAELRRSYFILFSLHNNAEIMSVFFRWQKRVLMMNPSSLFPFHIQQNSTEDQELIPVLLIRH